MARNPAAVDGFFAEVEEGSGAEPRLDTAVADLRAELSDLEDIQSRARRVVERMAIALQASLLVRYGDPAVADAFCASRLAGEGGRTYGTLPRRVDVAAIVERHRPRLG
jgi:putative acyl-CoA dehydrogenase